MGFESRHADEVLPREELAAVLARDHGLELARSRELLQRAEHEAAWDPQVRSVRHWFAILVEEDARQGPVVGKRTLVDSDKPGRRHATSRPIPGKETLAMYEARRWAEAADGADTEQPPGDVASQDSAGGTGRTPAASAVDRARAAGSRSTSLPMILRAREDGAVAPHARALVEQALRGIAESLDPALRARLEEWIGRSLGDVRVHLDAAAGAAALALGARAFTIGRDIFFRERTYDPSSTEGLRLIAHEVAHTQQTAPATMTDDLRTSVPGDPAEREADALADRLVAAQPIARDPRGSWLPGGGRLAPSSHRAVIALSDDGGQCVGPPSSMPAGGEPVNQLGIVMHDGTPQLRLRGSPSTTDDNIIGSLPFNTRVQVIKRFPGDWLFVSTSDGRMGYCAATYVWSGPEHPLPEPGARLHRVDAGSEGTAIAIAQRYFGDVSDDWGQDLRFYVNVIAAVNNIHVPSSVDGWRSVAFRAGQLIWIPSRQFAHGMIGRVSSGSYTYEAADALGIAGAIERAGELMSDFATAIQLSGRYIPEAVARHAEESIVSILQSLMLLAVGAVAILAISTAIGAAIGAIGGGVGAAPGAAVGFEVGMAIIDWLGLGFLIAWITTSVARIGSAFATFVGTVWNARGDREALERAAREFAEAIGVLVGVLIEAIVMWAVGQGLSRALAALRNTAIGRAFGESRLGTWLGERIAHYNAGESPVPGPREVALRSQARTLAPRLGLTEAEALALLRAMDARTLQGLHDEFGADRLRALAARPPSLVRAFTEALRVTSASDATGRAALMEGMRLNQRGTLSNAIFEQALAAYTRFRTTYGDRVSGDFVSRFWRSLSQRMDPRQAETEIRLAEDLLAGRTPMGETTGIEGLPESSVPGVRVPEYRATTPEGARLVESKAIGDPGQPITEGTVGRNARSANEQIRTQAQTTGETEGGLIRLDARDAGATAVTPQTVADWVSSRIPSPRSSRVTRWVELFYRDGAGRLTRTVLELEGTRFAVRSSEVMP